MRQMGRGEDGARMDEIRWRPRTIGVAVAALTLLSIPALGPSQAHGQVMPSERATVSQTVDGTVIQLDYARPRARGRDPLFGDVVHWGRVWTPGANDATVLEVSRDIVIEGNAVPAGRWSVWMVVLEQGPWELVLDPRDDLWHTAHPSEREDQVRFPVTATAGEHAEALAWTFPDVRRSGTTLAMAWGTTRVEVDIEVEPTYRYTVDAEEAAPFLGQWEMERVGGRNPGQVRDIHIVHHDDGSLRLVAEEGEHPFEWVLQPRAEGVFQLGWTHEGELWSGSDMYLEMTWEGDDPVRFDVRDGRDNVQWSGRRVR